MHDDTIKWVQGVLKNWPTGKVIIVSADKPEKHQDLIDAFKKAGIHGVWKVRSKRKAKK